MKEQSKLLLLFSILAISTRALAGSLPVINSPPQDQTVAPGSNVTLTVSASNTTVYEWRLNGTTIPGATGSALIVTNVQTSNSGYYLALAGNTHGWVPSQMAYLAVVGTAGRVPLSHRNIPWPQPPATYHWAGGFGGLPITNGIAQVVAGPELDQMQPPSPPVSVLVTNGYFHYPGGCFVPTVEPGQSVFYRVAISWPLPFTPGVTHTQVSTVLKLTAGGDSYPTPISTFGLSFPIWLEWPDPWPNPGQTAHLITTNRFLVCIAGETIAITNNFFGFTDYGVQTFQWRKDGKRIGSPTDFATNFYAYGNAVLTFTNFQASDAGVYDVEVLGHDCFIGGKNYLSLQLVSGHGLLQNPRLNGTDFICDLTGAETRKYQVQWSSNLASWTDLQIVTNLTGTVTFTNAIPSADPAFFRTRLLEF